MEPLPAASLVYTRRDATLEGWDQASMKREAQAWVLIFQERRDLPSSRPWPLEDQAMATCPEPGSRLSHAVSWKDPSKELEGPSPAFYQWPVWTSYQNLSYLAQKGCKEQVKCTAAPHHAGQVKNTSTTTSLPSPLLSFPPFSFIPPLFPPSLLCCLV